MAKFGGALKEQSRNAHSRADAAPHNLTIQQISSHEMSLSVSYAHEKMDRVEGGRMPSWGILAGVIAACWLGQYKIAFWMSVFNMLSGGVMVAAIVHDPSWPIARRSRDVLLLATDEDDEEEITAFVMTKVVFIAVSAVLCWYFGKWAGYF